MSRHDHEEGCLGTDLEIARRALAGGDLKHAFFHAAWGVQLSVDDRAALEALVREICTRAGDESKLVAGDGLSYAEAVGLALGRAAKGDRDGAVALLADALQVVPAAYSPQYIADWLLEGAAASVHVASALFATAGQSMGRLHLRLAERALIDRYVPIAQAVVVPKVASEHSLIAASGVLRRGGHGERAVAVAMMGVARGPESQNHWTQIGLARRLLEDTQGSMEAFDRAQQLGGDPITMSYERVRALIDARRYDDAQRALPNDPNADNDYEIRAMRGWLSERSRGAPGTYTQMLGDAPDSDDFRLSSILWAVGFFAPWDATVNALRQSERSGSKPKHMSCTAMEAPSCRLAVALACGAGTTAAEAPYSFSSVPTPDPRHSEFTDALNVWAYDDSVPRAVNAPAGPAVNEAIAKVRAHPKNMRRWWAEARALGPSLGPSMVSELLGACAAPPVVEAKQSVVDAVFEQQVAAMLLLANVDTGWQGSTRRRALLGVLHGTVDWVTACAVLALCEIALDDLSACSEIAGELRRAGARVPRPGWDWLEEVLVSSYMRVPGVSRSESDTFAKELRARARGDNRG